MQKHTTASTYRKYKKKIESFFIYNFLPSLWHPHGAAPHIVHTHFLRPCSGCLDRNIQRCSVDIVASGTNCGAETSNCRLLAWLYVVSVFCSPRAIPSLYPIVPRLKFLRRSSLHKHFQAPTQEYSFFLSHLI